MAILVGEVLVTTFVVILVSGWVVSLVFFLMICIFFILNFWPYFLVSLLLGIVVTVWWNVKLDSLDAVTLVKFVPSSRHLYASVFWHIKELLNKYWIVDLHHTLREVNA